MLRTSNWTRSTCIVATEESVSRNFVQQGSLYNDERESKSPTPSYRRGSLNRMFLSQCLTLALSEEYRSLRAKSLHFAMFDVGLYISTS